MHSQFEGLSERLPAMALQEQLNLLPFEHVHAWRALVLPEQLGAASASMEGAAVRLRQQMPPTQRLGSRNHSVSWKFSW